MGWAFMERSVCFSVDFLHENADDGGDDEDEVEEVPGGREVVVPQPDNLHSRLWNICIYKYV